MGYGWNVLKWWYLMKNDDGDKDYEIGAQNEIERESIFWLRPSQGDDILLNAIFRYWLMGYKKNVMDRWYSVKNEWKDKDFEIGSLHGIEKASKSCWWDNACGENWAKISRLGDWMRNNGYDISRLGGKIGQQKGFLDWSTRRHRTRDVAVRN